MIKIVMTGGNVITWKDHQYTDHKYDGKCFIVMLEDNSIGFYNLDHVISISIHEPDDEGGEPIDAISKRRSVEFQAVLSQEEVEGILKALSDRRQNDDG